MGNATGSTLVAADRWSIADVLARYCVAVDTGDHDLLHRVFSPDAALDYSAAGAGEGVGVEWFLTLAQGMSARVASQHSIGTSLIEAKGDGATGRTYITARVIPVDGDGEVNTISGWYVDEFARTGDDWIIVARKFVKAP